MQKEIRIRVSDEQHAVIEAAANKMAMPMSTYMRMAAMNHANDLGFHEQQPKVD